MELVTRMARKRREGVWSAAVDHNGRPSAVSTSCSLVARVTQGAGDLQALRALHLLLLGSQLGVAMYTQLGPVSPLGTMAQNTRIVLGMRD